MGCWSRPFQVMCKLDIIEMMSISKVPAFRKEYEDASCWRGFFFLRGIFVYMYYLRNVLFECKRGRGVTTLWMNKRINKTSVKAFVWWNEIYMHLHMKKFGITKSKKTCTWLLLGVRFTSVISSLPQTWSKRAPSEWVVFHRLSKGMLLHNVHTCKFTILDERSWKFMLKSPPITANYGANA